MTPAEQAAVIADVSWPLALRAKLAEVLSTMETLGAGTDQVRVEIDAIEVTASWTDTTVKVCAGIAAFGDQPLNTWHVPLTWITADPA